MKTTITLTSPIKTSPRILQMASMFDLPLEEKSTLVLNVDMPLEAKPWNVGLIVGPSGAGKSSIARHLWPDQLVTEQTWTRDNALIDDFPEEMRVRDVVGLLTAVGLGSPPAWIRPFHTLSNGEAFRASMARALAETTDLLVVDEFTSVVDRQVAQVASHTIQKTIRRAKRQFVAVTCHYDIEEWLQPDWTYDVAAAQFTWRTVQPHPRIELAIYPIDRSAWTMFKRHHYLSSDLASGAQCFGAYIGDKLVGFHAYRHFPHPKTKNIKMGHRTVVLPDYQGLGIGGRITDYIGQYLYEQGYRYRTVIAHPTMIHYHSTSPRWAETSAKTKTLAVSAKADKGLARHALNPRRLAVRSFEYRAPKRDDH